MTPLMQLIERMAPHGVSAEQCTVFLAEATVAGWALLPPDAAKAWREAQRSALRTALPEVAVNAIGMTAERVHEIAAETIETSYTTGQRTPVGVERYTWETHRLKWYAVLVVDIGATEVRGVSAFTEPAPTMMNPHQPISLGVVPGATCSDDVRGWFQSEYPGIAEWWRERGDHPMHRDAGMFDTIDDLRTACANVGVDLDCGACAETFYTGATMSGTAHECGKETASLEVTHDLPS